MKQKKLLILVILAIIVGVPLLGIFHKTVVQREVSMVAPSAGIDSMMSAGTAVAPMLPTQKMYPVPGNDTFIQDRAQLIVQSAQLSLEADNVQKAVTAITQITQNHKGYVTSSNVYQNSYVMQMNREAVQNQTTTGTLTLRVPSDQLNDTLAQIRKVATKVTQDTLSADDQTATQVNLEAQIKNLQTSQTQLQTIMKQAKTVEETLMVEQQLNRVSTQIDVLTAQLANVNSNAAMSEITVTITTNPTSDASSQLSQQPSLKAEAQLAFSEMLIVYRNLFVAGVRLVILILPLLVIGVIAWALWQRFGRKS